MYYPIRADKHLSGLRVVVKDSIDVVGAKTSGSSKDYAELYGVCNMSAPAVQKLLYLGAVIVGKIGMSQFADDQDPTGDFIDFHAPRSPRGDGNCVAGGSSFGFGAAAGAYKWLGFSVGKDSEPKAIPFTKRDFR